MNSNSFIGQIDLMALLGAQYTQVNGQDCIVIPVNANPAIFMSQARTGQPKAMLDVFIRETSNNQYGNTHFVKANVGKANRTALNLDSSELPRLSPILGNLKPLEAREETGSALADDDDLPEGDFKGF